MHQRDGDIACSHGPQHHGKPLRWHGEAHGDEECRDHDDRAEHGIGEKAGERPLEADKQRAVDVDHRRGKGQEHYRNEVLAEDALALAQHRQQRLAQQQHQHQRSDDVAIGTGHKCYELAPLTARTILGCEIGPHGVKAQRHHDGDQVDRRCDKQILAQQVGAPDARDKRLHQKDQARATEPRAEDDGRL
jgi:hypothetical protein